MLLRFLAFLVIAVVVIAIVLVITRSRVVADTQTEVEPATPQSPGTRHTDSVAAAREQVQHLEAAHARKVRDAQERLTQAGLDMPVMTLAGLRLGRLTLAADTRERWLTPQTRFSLEVTGEVRYVSVTEGDQLRIRPDDQRELHVLVQDPGWREEIILTGGDQLGEAERFVAAGGAAVRTLDEAREHRQRRIGAALDELAQARDDTDDLELARLTLEDLDGLGPARPDLPTPREDPEEDDPGQES